MNEPLQMISACAGDRSGLADRVKECIRLKEDELKKRHRTPAPGMEITHAYTAFMDDLLRALFHSLSAEFGTGSDTALVALGGYGRGELNIRSDIDLMHLYPRRITPRIEELTQKMLYVLWDAGLDVGFSIRSVNECIDLAMVDLKTKTSLLDARYLTGDEGLFAKLIDMVDKRLFSGKELRRFIDEKLEEKRLRHEKYGGSVYLLEPNVKEGEGGLRDLHAASWIVRAKNRCRFEPVEMGLLGEVERMSLDRSVDFLHWVRNDLHLETRTKKDQLTFDHQERIARLMGYKDIGDELGVETFMRQYYLHASNINNLSSLIISRCLDVRKAGPPSGRRKEVDRNFYVEDGHLSAASDAVFEREPEAIMKAFEYAQALKVEIDRHTKDLILANLHMIDDRFRTSAQVNESFLRILAGSGIYGVLSEMHRLKVLERYIPEFGAITCKVQHDLYHIYTVDVHSLFAVRELDRLREENRERFGLLAQILDEMGSPEILVLGVLLHDIGKAMGKGHAEKGAKLVPEICSRLGLNEDDGALLRFLVKHHLILADTAQYRDLHDERLIIEFARKVGDIERLQMLYLLTFADVRAVGAEVWSDWKAALFQELYFKAMTVLERGSFEVEDAGAKIERMKHKVKGLVRDEVSEEEVDIYFGLLPRRYFLSNDPESVARHLKTVRGLGSRPCVMEVRQVPERDYTEIIVCTLDVHGLFSTITGVMTANSVNILGAQINTLSNGMALDILQVKNLYGGLLTDESKLRKIEKDLTDTLTGRVRVKDLVGRIRPSILDMKMKPEVPTRVAVDNEVSEVFTVLDIHTQDRIGLLYKITSTLTEMGIYIYIAKISTKGDSAADIFYIKDIFSQKIRDPQAVKKIKDALYKALG